MSCAITRFLEPACYVSSLSSAAQPRSRFPNRPRNEPGKSLPFHVLLTNLFNPLIANKGFRGQSKQTRVDIIKRFMARWRNEVGPDIYPAFRLILPDKDRDRPMYGLKENRIAKVLNKAMGVFDRSDDGQALLNWKLPGRSGSTLAGDFAGRCHEVIKKRPILHELGSMTIDEVNDRLNKLSQTQKEEGQLPILKHFYEHMNPEELMWLIRIILRQMKIGATEKTVFLAWNPRAEDLYNVTSSLRRVCWELHDQDTELMDEDLQINLMQCFVPQRAQYQIPSFQKMLDRMGCTTEDPTFWIEEKLDGERMQLHMQRDRNAPGGMRLKFWSRNGKDYSYLYGEHAGDRNSALGCHIKDAFLPTVNSLVLDGEMITWDPEADAIVPFGTLKSAAISEKGAPGINAGPRPLFRIFDCLYCNGKNIAQYVLRERFDTLKAAVPRPVHRRLEIHEHVVATQASEIDPILRQVVAEASEGLVLKSPRSMYRQGARNSDWWKVKPEYMHEFGEDLDCVIVGGYFGSGRRGGNHSSYLCGLRVDGAADPIRCWSFFKVGGGFAASDYQAVRHATEGKWQTWDRKRPPLQHIELGGGERQFEQPDEWIRAEDSLVVAVKAAAVYTSESFRTGFTLRFPRFKKLCNDKDPRAALTLRDFAALRARAETEHKTHAFEMETQRKRRGAGKPRKKPLAVMGSGTAGGAYDGARTRALEGLTVYVVGGAEHPVKRTKEQLEQMVKANGGAIIQTHDKVPGTVCVADKPIVRASGLHKHEGVQIVRPVWLFDCIAQAEADGPAREPYRLPLEPRHLLLASEETEEWAKKNVDEYGDSYARDVGPDELREIVLRMKLPDAAEDAASFHAELAQRGRGVEGAPKAEMFRGLVLLFVPSPAQASNDTATTNGNAPSPTHDRMPKEDPLLGTAKSTARFAGAELADALAERRGITHVVVGTPGLSSDGDWPDDRERALRNEAARAVRAEVSRWTSPFPRAVRVEWIQRCWAEGTQLDEEKFAVC